MELTPPLNQILGATEQLFHVSVINQNQTVPHIKLIIIFNRGISEPPQELFLQVYRTSINCC